MGFLRNLDLDRTSFWLGFLAGFLFLWLLGRLRPGFSRLVEKHPGRDRGEPAEGDRRSRHPAAQ